MSAAIAKNCSRLKNYVNNCVLDRQVLGEFVFRCGSLFGAFLCCFRFPVKLLERLMKNNLKDGVKDAEFDFSHVNKTMPMIFPGSDSDVSAEKQSPPQFTFSFLRREFGNSGGNVTEVKLPTTTNSNRYQFMSGKDVCGFMEEPEARGFVVEEIFLNSSDNSEINTPNADAGSDQSDFIEEFFHLREESCDEEADDLSETLEWKEDIILAENYKNFNVEEEMSDENHKNFLEFVPGKDISSPKLDLKVDQFQDYYYYFHGTRPGSHLCTHPIIHDIQNTQITQTNSTTDDDDDYIEMEPYSPDSIHANEGFKGGKVSQTMKDEHEEAEKVSVENEKWESDANYNNNVEEDEDEDAFDILLEHQNLVKQMKKEVKNCSKVKRGLPTISEEGECAILKDLKPLKLEDKKFEYKDRLQEIRKFYKSYAHKMRKLDIFNYQSLQAINDGREKRDKLKEVDDSVSVVKLVEIVKESMEALWEFVRADKDENHTVSKGCLAHLQLLYDDHDDDDPELVINIKASLEKKERKLKLIQKAGNCIVKMFQKLPDQQSCEMMMAQVELKLVLRVLSLSRLSPDQLRWCERKLNCINIVNRRIYMEPHFSPFPC